MSKSAIVIYLLNCYRPSATFSAVFASVLTAVTRKSGAKLLIYFGLANKRHSFLGFHTEGFEVLRTLCVENRATAFPFSTLTAFAKTISQLFQIKSDLNQNNWEIVAPIREVVETENG
ncbi:MAG: hypothetical protein IKT92_06015 [Bacteroidaceae bacterium]|nr:hypothetical protein [Bacteroidaceae bacterium]